MKCKECRAVSTEASRPGGADSGPAEAHRKTCAGCAEFFETQLALQLALREVAAPDAPATVEGRVLAAFDGQRRARPRFRRWMPVFAAAVILTATVAIYRPWSQRRVTDAPFVEIPYIAPLAPYERTEIKRMDVAVAALIAAGFEVHAADAGASLRADVLFGQDGRARAIRLVN